MQEYEFSECEKLILQNKWDEANKLIKVLLKNPSKKTLAKVLEHVDCSILDENRKDFAVEVFRGLRNACVSHENQEFLTKSLILFQKIDKLLIESFRLELEDVKVLIKVLIQFLVNLIVSNSEGSSKVSQHLYSTILQCFLLRKNEYEVLALIYNLHLQNENIPFEKSLLKDVFSFYETCEYAKFLVELFVSDEVFWNLFEELEISNRIISLETLKDLWIHKKLRREVSQITLKMLSEKFSNSNNVIFQTVSSNDESLEPYEVSLLLELLASFCGDEKHLEYFQTDKELLIRCGVILINIHRIGKQSENYFTSIQKLSEIKEPSDVITQHPAFGFKVNLVRLIGNLCWKNKKMQDLTREAELIPILLDCCNIDARNPLIMQWVILAVRNLCENNLENQKIIAGLHKEGVVSSALVEEMGLTLHNDETGEIRIVPLNLKK